MTDIQAAVGRKQLERLPELVSRRRTSPPDMPNCSAISRDLRLPDEPDWARSNWQSYCVGLPERVEQESCHQNCSIKVSRHGEDYVRTPRASLLERRGRTQDLRQSEHAQDHSILLPIYAQMTEDNQVLIAETLKKELQV